MFRNGGHQLPAVGVRIAVEPGKGLRNGLLNGLGRAEGVGIGGKIQQDLSYVNVPAVGIFCVVKHQITSKRSSFIPQNRTRETIAVP